MSARRVSPVKFSEARVADLVVRVVPVPGTPLLLFFVAPLLSFAFICNFEERGCSNRHRCREQQGEAHPVPPLIVHSPQLSKLLRLL